MDILTFFIRNGIAIVLFLDVEFDSLYVDMGLWIDADIASVFEIFVKKCFYQLLYLIIIIIYNIKKIVKVNVNSGMMRKSKNKTAMFNTK